KQSDGKYNFPRGSRLGARLRRGERRRTFERRARLHYCGVRCQSSLRVSACGSTRRYLRASKSSVGILFVIRDPWFSLTNRPTKQPERHEKNTVRKRINFVFFREFCGQFRCSYRWSHRVLRRFRKPANPTCAATFSRVFT